MIPMISSLAEVKQVKEIVEESARSCAATRSRPATA